jgi:mRNA interferase RelE/StbE
MWRVEWSKKARKQLNKLDPFIAEKIVNYVKEVLEKYPDPREKAEKLVEDKIGWYRFRIEDYRLVFEMKDHILLIVVIGVGHRKDIYKD